MKNFLNYSEFLQDTVDLHAEWLDGRVAFYGSASEKHQLLLSFLNSLISLFVQLRDLGRVYTAPFQMRLARSGREPDLLFVHTNHLDPQHEHAEFYQLDGRGGYQLIRLHDGVYHSRQLPGLWIAPNWLWQDPLPSPLRTLAEIAGVDMSLVEAFERALGRKE